MTQLQEISFRFNPETGATQVTAPGQILDASGRPLAPVQEQSNAPVLKPEPIHELFRNVAGKGIYLGPWEGPDRDGHSLDTLFDYYAAPTDLVDINGNRLAKIYNDSIDALAALKDFHGHDGAPFENDSALYQAVLDNPEALGKWHIPDAHVLRNMLFINRNQGDLKETFAIIADDFNHARWYSSCTKHPDNSSNVYNVRFTNGDDAWVHKDVCRLSTRPVRAEPRALE